MKIGKYQVLGTLGNGAHSSILHIRRAADARHYALKIVKIDGAPERKFLEQAQHEFEVAQKLDHPNLIKVFALETERDWLMRIRQAHQLIEFVNGKTLDSIPRLGVPHLVQIFTKVAAGVVHMHRRSIYHADLKPNNIIVSRAGDVKVIDFGLAWVKGENKDRVQGTPEYMAPEQIKHRVANELTDIYNLGATMYRMVTWHLPPNALEAARSGNLADSRTWKKAIKPVEHYSPKSPPELCELIHRCLAYHACDRPQRAGELQEVLASLAGRLVRSDRDRLDSLEF
jgi:serine/threonine protein kinase